jgi:hypothetical protein
MDKEQKDYKRFLEQQIKWCKEQDRVLAELDIKLHEMKKIAQYALEQELTTIEIDELNGQINKLKNEAIFLEKQLHSVVH